MDEINVGDSVRSFDFDSHDLTGDRACYVEGVVEAIVKMEGCDRYAIRMTRRVFAGVEQAAQWWPRREDGMFYPPVNGTKKLFGGVTNGVEKI